MSNSSNIVAFHDQKQIEAEAACWFVKLDRGSLSREDHAVFTEWLAQSKQHRAALENMSDMWGGLEVLNELDDIAYAVTDEINPDQRYFNVRKTMFAVAASLLVFLAGGFVLLDMGVFRPQQSALYSTAVGVQKTVELPDGSTIKLNTNSQVRVDITRSERDVHLLKGEAYFEVAPDKKWPFLVYADKGLVRAVGTAFTVQLHERSFEVTVSEGRVAVLPTIMPTVSPDRAVEKMEADEDFTELTAGQNVIVGDKIQSVEVMQEAELERKLSWRTGVLVFAGEPLSKVVEDISRYTDVRIEIDDPALQNLPIGGYFKVGEVDALFDALEVTFGLEVEWEGEKRVRILPAT